MTIASLADYDAAFKQTARIAKSVNANSTSGRWMSEVLDAGDPSAMSSIGNTTTGVVPTSATTGFPTLQSVSGTTYLTQLRLTCSNSDIRGILCDRLWHAGPMVLNTNYSFSSQPSYLSRLPSGNYHGLLLYIEITTGPGGGSPNLSIGYTNQAGVAGRSTGSSTLVMLAGTGGMWPLQAGDLGVQSVDSLTVGGTAGSTQVDVAVLRPLCNFRGVATSWGNGAGGNSCESESVLGMEHIGVPVVPNNAALCFIYQAPVGTSSVMFYDLELELATK